MLLDDEAFIFDSKALERMFNQSQSQGQSQNQSQSQSQSQSQQSKQPLSSSSSLKERADARKEV